MERLKDILCNALSAVANHEIIQASRMQRKLGTGEQTMENLNAEDITNEIQSLIKTLKATGGWVKRGDCEGWFNHEILADALALINSQEQRIEAYRQELAEVSVALAEANKEREELTVDLKAMRGAANSYKMHNKKLTEENERLKRLCELRERDHNDALDLLYKAEADTLENIKIQFAMRYGTYTDKDMTPITEVFRLLDQIAKEMIGEGK